MKTKKIIALVCAALMLLSLAACGSKKDTYTVGICQLVQHPALDAATQGFKDALTEKLGDKVKFDEQNAAGDSATCSTICSTFVSSKVNLIMANATPAVQAAVAATDKIPVLGTSVTDYATALGMDAAEFTGKTGINLSGTSDLAPLDAQADMIKELFPDAKTVGILYCSAEPNSVYQVNTITPMIEALGYTVKAYSFADSNDVSAVSKTAAGENEVIYIPTDNTAASCTEAIANELLQAKVPAVTGEEGICAGCGVATLSISYYELGKATGEMAAQILADGKNPADMEIQFAPGFDKKFNKANAEALGVTIPADYIAIEE